MQYDNYKDFTGVVTGLRVKVREEKNEEVKAK